MKTQTHITHTLGNAALSLSSSSLSVSDSEAHEMVTIQGLNRAQIAREIRFWVLCLQHSHDESDRKEVLRALERLQETLTETIAKFSPETAEVTK